MWWREDDDRCGGEKVMMMGGEKVMIDVVERR